MRTLILFGFKGVGKSTYGKLLAEKMGKAFLDTDDLLIPDYRAFFKEVGEKKFRLLEAYTIQKITSFDGVIALGGGAILEPTSVAHLKKLGQLVYLEASKESLKKQMLSETLPAFLDDLSDFEKMYEERLPLYEKIESVKVCVENKSVPSILNELMEIVYGKQ